MKETVETDIAIIGGGIAGLWLLNRLRSLGLSVILLESATLGGEQTNKSQGIIHGGMKYALQGMLTKSATAIADMPALWKQCLSGNGEINLSDVPILSQKQYLWSTASLGSKLAGKFAGFTLKNTLSPLTKEFYPDIFQHQTFQGQVFSLDEIVIDAHALIRELMKPHQDVIFKIDPMTEEALHFTDHQQLSLQIHADPMPPLRIHAKKYIFTAGSGNELLLKQIKTNTIGMQKRPLHMVVMKQDTLQPLYAHCLGLSATPRITITTHRAADGKWVWYMGGQIAEEGVHRHPDEQIQATKKELSALFPWQDFSKAQFASFYINRAEHLQPDGNRPHSCYFKEIGNVIIAWPTKLALAPQLSEDIIHCLNQSQIKPCFSDIRALRAWPMPALAKPVWDELFI